MKKALITGITGQDGSYLEEFLLEKGYEVHGIIRRASVTTNASIDHIMDKLIIHEGDLSDSSSIIRIVLQVKPDDYAIATGVQHTVREFTTLAFANDGIELEWKGEGMDKKGYDKKTGRMLMCVNPKWYRPTDVVNLWGDHAKAKTKLGWNPQKTSYEQLCAIMAEHDLQLAKKEAGIQ